MSGRYKQNYSLYKRRMPNGKIIYYYRTYDQTGTKTIARSTYQTSKGKARLYCEELMKAGKLLPLSMEYFSSYASGFYDDGGKYFQHISKNRQISPNTLSVRRTFLNGRIMPYFRDVKLCNITRAKINEFQEYLLKEGLTGGSINGCCTTLKLILSAAVDDGLLIKNPFDTVKPVYAKVHSHDAFTIDECYRIIRSDWDSVYSFNAFVLGIFTGMRISEILAFRRETLHDGYIEVKDQNCRGLIKIPKGKKTRYIPICKEFENWLRQEMCDPFFIRMNEDRVTYQTSKVYAKAEVQNIRERNISFHSTRHFYNTYLMSTIPGCEYKIASVLGHKTGVTSVQGVYTNFKPEDYPEIIEAQSKLWDKLMKGFSLM